VGATPVLKSTDNFAGLQKYTGIVYGFAVANKTNGLTFASFVDPVVPANVSVIRVLNLVPDTPTVLVSLSNIGKNATANYGVTADSTVAPGTYTVTVYAPSAVSASAASVRSARRIRRRIQGVLYDFAPVATSSLTADSGSSYYVFVEGSGGKFQVVVDNPSTSSPSSSSGLSGGAIAGIVIASVVGAILVIGIIVYFWRRSQYSAIP
jgi:hypothetical protein